MRDRAVLMLQEIKQSVNVVSNCLKTCQLLAESSYGVVSKFAVKVESNVFTYLRHFAIVIS